MLPIAVAFLAGILTILSPCVLPVVPLVVGAGSTGRTARLVGVVIGFGTVFVGTTVLLAAVLATAGVSTASARVVAAVVLALFGATLVVPRLGAAVEVALAGRTGNAGSVLAPPTRRNRGPFDGLAGGIVLGAAIGLVWAPCVGPIMAAAIAASVASGPSMSSAVPAGAYVLGASIPLVVVALAGRRALDRVAGPAARMRVTRGFGALVVVSALAIATGFDLRVQAAVASALPDGWTAALVSIEAPGANEEDRTMAGTRRPLAPSIDQPGLPPSVAATLPASVALEDLGNAPEVSGVTDWINSEPLTLASLRGKVVLVHFWTFGCINCVHVQPYVKAWYERYADAGLVVLGVHTPELSFERDIANVRDAVANADVRFPVAFDPSFDTWRAYGNQYWPAFYFVDREGRIRHVHFGEGDYDGSEQVIRELLAGA